MSYTPHGFRCFKDVAKIIGEEVAEEELQKVIDYAILDDNDLRLTEHNVCDFGLLGAFNWSSTPQGGEYWSDIYGRILRQED